MNRRALRDYPQAEAARVRLYRYDTLGPADVRAGKKPEGDYKEKREMTRNQLR